MNKKTLTKSAILLLLVASVIAIGVGIHHESISINFGSSQDSVPFKRLKHKRCSSLNREGLDNLNSYGSGIINYHDFKSHLMNKPGKFHFVNLLHDHLYYYNDRCLRWYGLGYTPQTLGHVMFSHKPLKYSYKSIIRLIFGSPPIHDLNSLKTEEQIVHELGGTYSIPLKDNPEWLSHQEFMADLIRFFEELPENEPVYFHCGHGKGRTTTFLVLYDIFRNSKKVSLEDISNRHYCLGREDVLDTKLLATGTWTQEALIARKNLVERFYLFMNDKEGYSHQSWAQWNNSKGFVSPQVTIHRRKSFS